MSEKEMTMDELKSVITEGTVEALQSHGLLDSEGKVLVAALPAEVKSEAVQRNERAEETKTFIKAVIEGKAISSAGNSFGPAVPTHLYHEIIKKRDAYSHIRKHAFVIDQAGNLDLPKDGTMVSMDWYGENTAVDESNPTLAKTSFADHYLSGLVKIPYKLLNGSPLALEKYVIELLGRAIARKEEQAFIGGSGTGQPTGVRTVTPAVGQSVPQAGANLAYDDVIDVVYNVPAQYRESGSTVVITSNKGVKLLRKLKDLDGLPVFDATSKTVLGLPLLESVDVPANLGSGTNETEILVVDLSQYWIKDGEEMQAKVQDAPKSLQYELTAYQATDGGLLFTEAVSKLTAVK